jgi:8-oxo-dGTP pyrophosphatase MutT (NUDIX family)
MRYKIYFGDHPLYLTDELDQEMNEIMHHDDGVYMDELSNPGIKSMIHEMKLPQHHAGVFYHEDIDKLFKSFRKHFDLITAAGGVVRNDDDHVLMIFRRGKWDLPKGKLDKGESIEDCAIREVEEETGIRHTSLAGTLMTTYHVYDEFGKHILKETHWFNMKSPGTQPLIPQEAEQITASEWASEDRIDELLNNSYQLVREILRTNH